MAFYDLDFVLKYACKIGEDKPHSKRQEKFKKMLILQANTSFFKPYFTKIKMIVGVKKDGNKNMYCITSIKEEKE